MGQFFEKKRGYSSSFVHTSRLAAILCRMGPMLARILTRQSYSRSRAIEQASSAPFFYPQLPLCIPTSRAPPRPHHLNKHGGLPRRLLQGASPLRPRGSGCSAYPRPPSLSRQAAQEALLLRGLHGGKELPSSILHHFVSFPRPVLENGVVL